MADVWINGKYVGFVEDTKRFIETVKENRRNGILPYFLNVFYDDERDEVHIETSKGRAVRPLIVVKDGKSMLTEMHLKKLSSGELKWSDLVQQGIIEYLDAAEEENAYIALTEEELTPEHTHLEISPLAMLGTAASLVPFGNYNQSARYSIGAKSQKQGVGLYITNFHLRNDPDVNVLHEPQIPLVKTFVHDLIQYDSHPAGQNLIVAVMTYEGYNMEDAIVMNLSAVQRGLMRSTYYYPFVTEEYKYSGGLMDKFMIPDKDVIGYRSEHAYRFLEEDGLVSPGIEVEEGDVLVGRVSPPRFLSASDEYNLLSRSRRETSLALEHGQRGVVDSVILTETENGNRMVSIKVRENKIPEIGDKFSSRHGQKGVVGFLVPEFDMPFSANGITPDILFTPFGIPSRMTIAHLLELLAGKVAALRGDYVDGTVFENESEEDLRKQLIQLGFRDDGFETFYDGITGKLFRARVYVGNIYYMRLRHLVSNKLHARARGKVQLLTRQPTEGKKKQGGLRLSEMEMDALVAHGASMLLNERYGSDTVDIAVCKTCGSIAIEDHINHRLRCPICGETTNIGKVQISYAFKLFLDELTSLGIKPRISLKKKHE